MKIPNPHIWEATTSEYLPDLFDNKTETIAMMNNSDCSHNFSAPGMSLY